MILIESGLEPEIPLNHARFLYRDKIALISASSSATNRPASAMLTWQTYERWEPSAGATAATITITPNGETFSALGIAAHTLSVCDTVEVRVGVGGAAETISHFPAQGSTLDLDFEDESFREFNPYPDNETTLILMKEKAASNQVEIYMTWSGEPPTIGKLILGDALAMERPFYGGHAPAMLNRSTQTVPNISESGEWLGRSLIRQGRSARMQWDNLTASWYRRYFEPLIEHATKLPFIVAWNPLQFPSDCLYASTEGDAAPSNKGTRNLMTVSLSMRAYSDKTPANVTQLVEKDFSEIVTFTRASSGTYYDRYGILKTAITDQPRFDHDPVTGEALGLLIEEQRTNVIRQSEGWSASPWSVGAGASVAVDALTGPDGTTLVDRITVAARSGGAIFQSISGLTASTRFEPSFYVFNEGVSRVLRLESTIAASFGDWSIDLSLVPQGVWVRITRDHAAVSISTEFSTDSGGSGGLYFYSDDGASLTIGATAAQFEQGAFPTSYIKTTTAQVTRSSDVPSSPIGEAFNTEALSFYFEASTFRLAGLGWIFQTGDRAPELFFNTDAGTLAIQISGAGATLPLSSGVNRVAGCVISGQEMRLSVNGVYTSVSITSSISGDTLYFGHQNTSSERYLNGVIKRGLFIPRALSATELEALTS